jgi:hypothetical protein
VRSGETTGAKRVDGEPAEVFRAVVLTDSNGRDIGPRRLTTSRPIYLRIEEGGTTSGWW